MKGTIYSFMQEEIRLRIHKCVIIHRRAWSFRMKKVSTSTDADFTWFVLKTYIIFILFFLSFFENMNRIIAPKYVPTEMDVLRVRVRTCGIVEMHFQLNQIIFR